MKYKLEKDLLGHQGAVYALSPGPRANQFFSGGSDRKVILWNLELMEAEKVVAQSPTTVISLAYLAQSETLLIGQAEGGIHVLDLKGGKEIHYLKKHESYVFKIIELPGLNQFAAVSGDGSFSVWSSDDFQLLYYSKRCTAKIRGLLYLESSQQLLLGLGTGILELWDAKQWKLIQSLDAFQSSINSLFQVDNSRLLIGEKDAYLSELDLNDTHLLKKIPAHNWAIYDMAQGKDTQRFVTASRDKTIKIWDAKTLSVLQRLEGFKDRAHTHSVNQVLWTTFKDYIVSTGDDGKIKVWKEA